jgi:hypothetical protein
VKIMPDILPAVREARAFLVRVVRFLAGEEGIRQFLDIGTGLPTANNTHEVAQQVAPDSRIVYVDNDPLVLAHARALLTSSREGKTAYLDADLRDAGKILDAAAQTLDLYITTEPAKRTAQLTVDLAVGRYSGTLEKVPGLGDAASYVGSDAATADGLAWQTLVTSRVEGSQMRTVLLLAYCKGDAKSKLIALARSVLARI